MREFQRTLARHASVFVPLSNIQAFHDRVVESNGALTALWLLSGGNLDAHENPFVHGLFANVLDDLAAKLHRSTVAPVVVAYTQLGAEHVALSELPIHKWRRFRPAYSAVDPVKRRQQTTGGLLAAVSDGGSATLADDCNEHPLFGCEDTPRHGQNLLVASTADGTWLWTYLQYKPAPEEPEVANQDLMYEVVVEMLREAQPVLWRGVPRVQDKADGHVVLPLPRGLQAVADAQLIARLQHCAGSKFANASGITLTDLLSGAATSAVHSYAAHAIEQLQATKLRAAVFVSWHDTVIPVCGAPLVRGVWDSEIDLTDAILRRIMESPTLQADVAVIPIDLMDLPHIPRPSAVSLEDDTWYRCGDVAVLLDALDEKDSRGVVRSDAASDLTFDDDAGSDYTGASAGSESHVDMDSQTDMSSLDSLSSVISMPSGAQSLHDGGQSRLRGRGRGRSRGRTAQRGSRSRSRSRSLSPMDEHPGDQSVKRATPTMQLRVQCAHRLQALAAAICKAPGMSIDTITALHPAVNIRPALETFLEDMSGMPYTKRQPWWAQQSSASALPAQEFMRAMVGGYFSGARGSEPAIMQQLKLTLSFLLSRGVLSQPRSFVGFQDMETSLASIHNLVGLVAAGTDQDLAAFYQVYGSAVKLREGQVPDADKYVHATLAPSGSRGRRAGHSRRAVSMGGAIRMKERFARTLATWKDTAKQDAGGGAQADSAPVVTFRRRAVGNINSGPSHGAQYVSVTGLLAQTTFSNVGVTAGGEAGFGLCQRGVAALGDMQSTSIATILARERDGDVTLTSPPITTAANSVVASYLFASSRYEVDARLLPEMKIMRRFETAEFCRCLRTSYGTVDVAFLLFPPPQQLTFRTREASVLLGVIHAAKHELHSVLSSHAHRMRRVLLFTDPAKYPPNNADIVMRRDLLFDHHDELLGTTAGTYTSTTQRLEKAASKASQEKRERMREEAKAAGNAAGEKQPHTSEKQKGMAEATVETDKHGNILHGIPETTFREWCKKKGFEEPPPHDVTMRDLCARKLELEAAGHPQVPTLDVILLQIANGELDVHKPDAARPQSRAEQRLSPPALMQQGPVSAADDDDSDADLPMSMGGKPRRHHNAAAATNPPVADVEHPSTSAVSAPVAATGSSVAKFVVYGKPACGFTKRAVDVLFRNRVPFTFVAVNCAADSVVPPHPSQHVTVPVIFDGHGAFVGGYTDLIHHLNVGNDGAA
jgi:glutaredoxin